MFRYICISMLCLLVANAQPLSCEMDAHCSDGYYCETQANLCHKCLRCQYLNRNPPKLNISDVLCIKSINRCGACSEGFINIYTNDVKGMCVTPEFFEIGSQSQYLYLWMTAMVIGIFVVVTFVYVIIHTDVFWIVAHYHPLSGNAPSFGVYCVIISSYFEVLHLDKNPESELVN